MAKANDRTSGKARRIFCYAVLTGFNVGQGFLASREPSISHRLCVASFFSALPGPVLAGMQHRTFSTRFFYTMLSEMPTLLLIESLAMLSGLIVGMTFSVDEPTAHRCVDSHRS